MTNNDSIEIEEETRHRIREQVLKAEEKQLHLDRPHKIIPEITEIIESEVEEVDEVSHDTEGDV